VGIREGPAKDRPKLGCCLLRIVVADCLVAFAGGQKTTCSRADRLDFGCISVASRFRQTRCREDLLTQIKQLAEALDRLRLQIFLESSEPRLPDVTVSSQLSRHNNGLSYRDPCETQKREPTALP
jgi:hypothetical protein